MLLCKNFKLFFNISLSSVFTFQRSFWSPPHSFLLVKLVVTENIRKLLTLCACWWCVVSLPPIHRLKSNTHSEGIKAFERAVGHQHQALIHGISDPSTLVASCLPLVPCGDSATRSHLWSTLGQLALRSWPCPDCRQMSNKVLLFANYLC